MKVHNFLCKKCNTTGTVTETSNGTSVSPCLCQTVASTDYDPMCGCATCEHERVDVKVSLVDVFSFINSDAMWEKLVDYEERNDPEHGCSKTMDFIAREVLRHFRTK